LQWKNDEARKCLARSSLLQGNFIFDFNIKKAKINVFHSVAYELPG
jgi:hypothetical protein